MAGKTQRESNPFPFTDTNKRYHTFDYYLRARYGGKCAVIPLDAGLSCPNIDGTRGVGGCIYCSSRGSGDFAGDAREPLAVQFAAGRERVLEKWDCTRFIPYLQAHTNTHAPKEMLARILREFAALPGVAYHIATRADCIDETTADMLAAFAEGRDLTVELGLQSIHDKTAERINRCHTYAEFLAGYRLLRAASPRIRVCIHLILGLPGEGREEMMQSIEAVAALGAEEIKLHLLYVVAGTPLAAMWERGEYIPLTQEDYTELVVSALERIPPEVVIGRVTGDGAWDTLLAPLWSRKKLAAVNEIDKKLFERNTWQGKKQ